MPIPDIIKQTARDLRKNQTYAEKVFWNTLRRETGKLKVYRQKPIRIMCENNGFERYIIPDFYFPHGKLIVEIDGSIHRQERVYSLDRQKEILLTKMGYKVLRFTNEEVLQDFDGVMKKIVASFSS